SALGPPRRRRSRTAGRRPPRSRRSSSAPPPRASPEEVWRASARSDSVQNMTDAAAAAVGHGFASARPAGPWRIAVRRLRRDRAAVFGFCFIVFLLLAVGAGAPVAGALLGHGPNDPFPYAVDVNLKPA